ncbi:uncharacterized protein LOC124936216 [Impatiens glandulifera]|uniref:uncharacterized protein LOC124936216 n=1 Tax=Impatiens glandulifera TaxID=253017 RepID=UPI001FB14ECC|nr:uncharacterized protein LOC124936216 [Impatiens glandulifera]
MKRRRNLFFKTPIAIISTVISLLCFLILILSIFKLPEISAKRSSTHLMNSNNPPEKREILSTGGRFAETILEMLPENLVFTIFMPSDRAFERDLGLKANESLEEEKSGNTYAILTRVLGFSALPRAIYSDSVPIQGEVCYDSISGFNLCMYRELDGMLRVNGVRSEKVDVKMGEKVVVHIMNGAIMDSEFQQSVQPDEEDDSITDDG